MPNPGKQSLNAQIADLKAEIARKDAAIEETQSLARRSIQTAKDDAEAAGARADQLENENRNLKQRIAERDIEIARLEGYLDRVYEEDDVGAARVSTSQAPATEMVRKRRPSRESTMFTRRWEPWPGAVMVRDAEARSP